MKVTLCHIVLTCLEPFIVSGEENSLALAAGLRLHNEGFGLFAVKLLLEVFSVLGEKPRLREEIEVLRASLLDCHEILSEQVLPREGIHPREMICPLIRLHLQ